MEALEAGGGTNPETDAALWGIVTVGVWTNAGANPPACDADTATSEDWTEIVAPDTALGAEAPAAQTLAAAPTSPGTPQNYCFALTLPNTPVIAGNQALQGLVISPAWEFAAVSD